MGRKVINNFIKQNFLKISHFNNNKKILLIDRGISDSAIMNSLFAYRLNKTQNYNIDLASDLSIGNDIINIYNSFGINNLIKINIREIFKDFYLFFNTNICFIATYFKILFLGRTWFINKFKVKNIYFGDLIYDDYIRRNLNFLKRNLNNSRFLKTLFISIFKIFFLNNLINNKKYNYVMSPTHTYASNAALGMRIALKKKIKVLNILSSRLRVYTKSFEAEKIEYILDLKYLKDSKIFDKSWLNRFDLMMKNRYAGNIKYVTAKDAYYNKQNITKNNFFKIFNLSQKNFKRIVFFAPHCFSDANHKAGRLIFDDYYDQFQTTIKFAKKDKNSLWIIKIHPTSYKYKEENVINQLIKNKEVNNIVICPNQLSTFALIKFSDLIITGRGTIGLESACFGKKPLLAGETFYSKFGITHNPSNRNDYLQKLSRYNIQTKLNIKQIQIAKKLFYLVVFKNSYTKKDKIMVSNYIRVDTKQKKLYQQFLNEDEFIRQLAKQLGKRVDISKDAIFLNFEKILMRQK
ncbi:hypothetical protein OAY95_04840 [Candidatus Pelagibacter sp.]|nr:hypothetical protein [Candidatus Pelagibacter sp.]